MSNHVFCVLIFPKIIKSDTWIFADILVVSGQNTLLLEIFRFFGGMARNKGLQCRHARPWVAHGNAWGQVWIGHGSGMDQGMDRNPMTFCKILVLQDLHCNSMNLGKTTGLSQTNKAGTVCRVTGSKPRKPQKH